MEPKVPTKILFADDEADIRIIVQAALEKAGCRVELAATGEEALAKAATFAPDLILLDVSLSDTDGMALLEKMKGLKPPMTVPVIFLTARVQDHEIARYAASGVLGVIPKPFDPHKLFDTIGLLWSRREKAYSLLVADDDTDYVHLLREELESEGYSVTVATEGVRVMEMARKMHPDLILLDVHMPAGSGDTVLKNLKAHPETSRIPVIMMTAYKESRLEKEMKAAGADGFFSKAFENRVFLDKIRATLLKTSH